MIRLLASSTMPWLLSFYPRLAYTQKEHGPEFHSLASHPSLSVAVDRLVVYPGRRAAVLLPCSRCPGAPTQRRLAANSCGGAHRSLGRTDDYAIHRLGYAGISRQ